MKLGLDLRKDICGRRGWHRCREVENPPNDLRAAVCRECATAGPLSWAAVNLLREYKAESRYGAISEAQSAPGSTQGRKR